MEIKNISKHYDDKKLFENINLKFDCPKLIFILGKSGTGKSTLLNIIRSV